MGIKGRCPNSMGLPTVQYALSLYYSWVNADENEHKMYAYYALFKEY
jgi:hypothetical protein